MHIFWKNVLATGLSQNEIARKAQLTKSKVSNQIINEKGPTLDDAMKIARALDIPLSILTEEKTEVPKREMTLADFQNKEQSQDITTERLAVALSKLEGILNRGMAINKTVERHIAFMRDLQKPATLNTYSVSIPVFEGANDDNEGWYSIKELGTVAAGSMREAWEASDKTHQVPARHIPSGHQHEYFILRVSGRSMINYGIEDGSYCLIKKTNSAERGQVVVVRDGDSVTLKQLIQDEQNNTLLAYQDGSGRKILCTPQMEIIGVFVQILRA